MYILIDQSSKELQDKKKIKTQNEKLTSLKRIVQTPTLLEIFSPAITHFLHDYNKKNTRRNEFRNTHTPNLVVFYSL